MAMATLPIVLWQMVLMSVAHCKHGLVQPVLSQGLKAPFCTFCTEQWQPLVLTQHQVWTIQRACRAATLLSTFILLADLMMGSKTFPACRWHGWNHTAPELQRSSVCTLVWQLSAPCDAQRQADGA